LHYFPENNVSNDIRENELIYTFLIIKPAPLVYVCRQDFKI
jgi:hypothetical protein